MTTTNSTMKNAQMHYLLGCDFITLIKLIWNNKKDISFNKIPMMIYVMLISFLFIPFVWIENLKHAKKIANTKIEKPPIFVVGHWRSGTTYLTNIMSKDVTKGYFTAEKTYTHSTFLTLGKLLQKVYPKVLPKKRPMDNLKMGLNEPAEEVFALGNYTQYSVIHMLSFPKNARFYAKCAFYDELSERQKRKIRNSYEKIIKKLTYYTQGKQLILKSPDNTCRINMLLDLYPDAKFIHIYRNPYKVFPSTMVMYKSLFPIFSFEEISDEMTETAEDVVLDIYEKLYVNYLETKKNIPEANLIEIKYEDFVLKPKEYIEEIYSQLSIPGYEDAKDTMFDYIDSQKTYKTNKHNQDRRNMARINKKMKFLFNQYGYAIDETC